MFIIILWWLRLLIKVRSTGNNNSKPRRRTEIMYFLQSLHCTCSGLSYSQFLRLTGNYLHLFLKVTSFLLMKAAAINILFWNNYFLYVSCWIFLITISHILQSKLLSIDSYYRYDYSFASSHCFYKRETALIKCNIILNFIILSIIFIS